MNPRVPSLLSVAALASSALLAWPRAGDDLAAKLQSRELQQRLAAIETIRKDGAKEAEKLLLGALEDRDWEVMERAAATLAERGTAASVDRLCKLALDGPVRRIRITAAKSLAKLDAKAAAEHLEKAAKGPTLMRAVEGLAQIGPAAGELAQKGLSLGLKSSEANVRAAAAAGLAAFPAADRGPLLQKCAQESDLTVGAAALDAVSTKPERALLPTLLEILGRRELHDVLVRRTVRAIHDVYAAASKEERKELDAKVFAALAAAVSDSVRTRFALLLGVLAAKPKRSDDGAAPDPAAAEPLVAANDAAGAIDSLFATMTDEGTRAALVHALGRIGSEGALDRIATLAKSERSARVRAVALRDLVAGLGAQNPACVDLAKRCLEDKEADLREDAAVALGHPKIPGAVSALAPKLKDPDWTVAVAAAVSLGKTQDASALAPLTALLADKDWKLHAAAVVGLGHLKQKQAVPLLIDALGSHKSTVKLTALEFLRRMTNEKVAPHAMGWKSWWQRNEATYEFLDDTEFLKKQQKYGYAPTAYGVYEDLDVIVFQSRGDHIEKLLEKLKIAHRTTRLGNVAEAGVEPFGVYVANCTGECSPEDLEQVSWFVHAGGYLFSSCWALTFHADRVRPGCARHFATPAQVLDLVTAEPCCESPFFAGVFDGVTRPKYVLEGSYLIEVQDPERVEVLIDSPEAATRWGCGNLAAWWNVGHGLILDSANHFDLQGFDRAPPMKEAGERMAYAVDTLGLSYADWREVPKVAWTSQKQAADEVRDLSAFRFITNFVRFKRRSGT